MNFLLKYLDITKAELQVIFILSAWLAFWLGAYMASGLDWTISIGAGPGALLLVVALFAQLYEAIAIAIGLIEKDD